MANTPEARTETGELKNAESLATGNTNSNEQNAPQAPKNSEASGAPESYSDFTAPEGQTLDKDLIAEATPIFKEMNLTQEQAQKLVDFYSKSAGGINAKLEQSVTDMQVEWRKQVLADKDLGPQIEKVKVEIGRAKDRLPAEVRTAFDEALNLTGMGDHPALVKAIYEFSKLVNEGTHVSGTGPSAEGQNSAGKAQRPTLAGAMYPHLPH